MFAFIVVMANSSVDYQILSVCAICFRLIGVLCLYTLSLNATCCLSKGKNRFKFSSRFYLFPAPKKDTFHHSLQQNMCSVTFLFSATNKEIQRPQCISNSSIAIIDAFHNYISKCCEVIQAVYCSNVAVLSLTVFLIHVCIPYVKLQDEDEEHSYWCCAIISFFRV